MKPWNLRSILLPEASKSAGLDLQFAVIVLNRPVDDITAEPIFDGIWARACWRLCADGGANRLYDSISGNKDRLNRLLPDEILGDLDSLRDDVFKFYQDESVTITKVHDQDTTDFQKCLLRLQELEASRAFKQGSLVVLVFGAIGGRFDQTMSSINSLCQFKDREVYLLGSSNCISLLNEGSHELILTKGMEGPHCGLIPISGKSRIKTKGLKWDMQEDWVSEFGGLVSTSNLIDDQENGDKDHIVTVEVMEGVVVWTTEFNAKFLSANPFNILLGVTGSVAAIKTAKILELLLALKGPEINIKVEIVLTEASRHFFKIDEHPELIQSGVKVWRDSNEWELWNKRNDPVLHIELRKWADILLIAPLDANTLAKISTGLCDNLLTCVARAWDFSKPIFVAPAMNTFMWDHPVTSRQIETIKSWGFGILEPISKVLMCGDVGSGAMQEPEQIVAAVFQRISDMQ